MKNVSTETADECLCKPATNASICVEASFERVGAKPQDGLAERYAIFAKAYLR